MKRLCVWSFLFHLVQVILFSVFTQIKRYNPSMVCAILKQYWWLFAFWKITPLIVGSSAFVVVGRESDAVLVSNINPSQVHCIAFYSDIAGNKDYFIAPVEKIAYSALQVLRPVLALVFFLLLVILEKFYYFALLWCFVKKKYWI